MGELRVHSIPLGAFQTNCHILEDVERREAVVVDPGDEGEELLAFIKKLGVRVVAIWNTHAHLDHIGANAALQKATGAPLSIHRLSAPALGSAVLSGAAMFGFPFTPSKADILWNGGEVLEVLGRKWLVRHNPGHSVGCCSIICEAENLMIGGDLLFQGAIGRTDLPGGSPEVMTASLRALFNDWGKDEWTVLTGHGDNTTIGEERTSNFLVRLALSEGLVET